MEDLDRWTPASSNCLGYDPENGELVKYEEAMAVIRGIEKERNDALHRVHEAQEQMRACHEILDRLGAPRNQDNGLNYHLNGRLSRLVANETGQLWAARMEELKALLRRARAVIPDEFEDEIQVRTDINRYLNAHQG